MKYRFCLLKDGQTCLFGWEKAWCGVSVRIRGNYGYCGDFRPTALPVKAIPKITTLTVLHIETESINKPLTGVTIIEVLSG